MGTFKNIKMADSPTTIPALGPALRQGLPRDETDGGRRLLVAGKPRSEAEVRVRGQPGAVPPACAVHEPDADRLRFGTEAQHVAQVANGAGVPGAGAPRVRAEPVSASA